VSQSHKLLSNILFILKESSFIPYKKIMLRIFSRNKNPKERERGKNVPVLSCSMFAAISKNHLITQPSKKRMSTTTTSFFFFSFSIPLKYIS